MDDIVGLFPYRVRDLLRVLGGQEGALDDYYVVILDESGELNQLARLDVVDTDDGVTVVMLVTLKSLTFLKKEPGSN